MNFIIYYYVIDQLLQADKFKIYYHIALFYSNNDAIKVFPTTAHFNS